MTYVLRMLLVDIYGFTINNLGFVLLLKPKKNKSDRIFPICCGPTELNAICGVWQPGNYSKSNSNKVKKRPDTHALMKNIFDSINCSVQKVEINKIERKVLYSKIYIQLNNVSTQKKLFFLRDETEQTLIIDARPSDALSLALSYQVPIYINKDLFHSLSVSKQDVKNIHTQNLIPEYFSQQSFFVDEEDDAPLAEIPFFVTDTSSKEEMSSLLHNFKKVRSRKKSTSSIKKSPSSLLSKKDVLEKMLSTAVNNEDYESAAQIKTELDLLKKLKK